MTTTEVKITFKVPNESYNEYENILDDFAINLADIGVTDFDTIEKEIKEQ